MTCMCGTRKYYARMLPRRASMLRHLNEYNNHSYKQSTILCLYMGYRCYIIAFFLSSPLLASQNSITTITMTDDNEIDSEMPLSAAFRLANCFESLSCPRAILHKLLHRPTFLFRPIDSPNCALRFSLLQPCSRTMSLKRSIPSLSLSVTGTNGNCSDADAYHD